MKKSKLMSVLEMLILIAAGFLLMLHPGGSLNVAVRVLGIALVAYGVIDAIGCFLKKKDRSVGKLIIGIASVIGGIVVLAGPQFVINIFPIVGGVTVAVAGVRDLLDALEMKKLGFDSWKLFLILACITIALGILIFANPFGTMETVAVVFGLSLLYSGIVGLISACKS